MSWLVISKVVGYGGGLLTLLPAIHIALLSIGFRWSPRPSDSEGIRDMLDIMWEHEVGSLPRQYYRAYAH
jgi:hypothetical protein